jgi:hypothetical protein
VGRPDARGKEVVELTTEQKKALALAAARLRVAESKPTQPLMNPAGVVGGVSEAILNLGTGALAAPIAGGAGILGSILPGPQGQGAELVGKVQQALTFQPRTQQGQEAQAAVSYLPEQFAKGADWVGGKVTDVTGSPAAGTAANVAINAVPLLLGKRALTAKPAAPTAKTPITEAFESGYKLTPTQAERGIIPRALEGISGSAKLEKLASIKNAEVTNRLIKQDLGIPDKQPITTQTLEAIRATEGKAYEAVKSSVKIIKPDKKFAEDLQKLRGDFSEAAKSYPDIIQNAQVEGLIDSLNVPASPRAMVELTRKLRKDASANLKSFDDPGKQELGFAQRNAATALENMIDRALTSVGKKGLVADWRSARQKIAQTYDVEAALNETTGNVSAQYLGQLYKKGKPFTGGMGKAAKFARQFERSARDVDKMKDVTQFGRLDALIGMLAAGGGGAYAGPYGAAAGAATAAAVPLLRQLLLQKSKPTSLLPPLGTTGLLPLLGQQNNN